MLQLLLRAPRGGRFSFVNFTTKISKTSSTLSAYEIY
nr:MAG TPA: hypothetical protein [Bacteriophage sp.]